MKQQITLPLLRYLRPAHLIVIAAILLNIATPSFAAPIAQQKPEIDWLSQYQGPDEAGTTVLLSRGGKILRQETLGMANLELGVRLRADHRFRIGSITKMFVAVLALQLLDEGKLELDSPIHRYLPDLPPSWQAITVAHLLSHTSGIPDYLGGPQGGYSALRGKRLSQDELIKLFYAWPLQFEPGSQFIYSNSGYVVLSRLLETITHQSFSTLLTQRITEPLGMSNTFAKLEEHIIPGMVTGYTSGKQPTFITKLDGAFPDGSMISTSADLVKFAQALLDRRLLSQASFDKMHTPFMLTNGEKSEYGFGAFLRRSQGHLLVGHGGDIFGFHAMLEFDLATKAIAVILRNSDQFGARRLTAADYLSRRLLAEANGRPIAEPRTIALTPEQLQKYLGDYPTKSGVRHIRYKQGHLTSQLNAGTEYELNAYSPNAFFIPRSEFRIRFELQHDGSVVPVVFQDDGKEPPAPADGKTRNDGQLRTPNIRQ